MLIDIAPAWEKQIKHHCIPVPKHDRIFALALADYPPLPTNRYALQSQHVHYKEKGGEVEGGREDAPSRRVRGGKEDKSEGEGMLADHLTADVMEPAWDQKAKQVSTKVYMPWLSLLIVPPLLT